MATSASTGLGIPSMVANVPMGQEGGGGDTTAPPLEHGMPHIVWTSDTDLVFIPGTTRLSLTIQSPPLRAIIHDAFENLRAFLLFDHSFPDGAAILTVIRDCLLTAAAESRNPRAPVIHDRMTREDGYLNHLICLVSVP